MHEFSIAEALAAQVALYAPAGGRVLEVEIRVGALRGLEPEAMRMCWDAVTYQTPLAGSSLLMDTRPWSLVCPACGREWESPVPFVTCECGEQSPNPTADDELLLVAISTEDDVPGLSDVTESPGSASASSPTEAPR